MGTLEKWEVTVTSFEMFFLPSNFKGQSNSESQGYTKGGKTLRSSFSFKMNIKT